LRNVLYKSFLYGRLLNVFCYERRNSERFLGDILNVPVFKGRRLIDINVFKRISRR
jgi:hypothetical protein